MTIDYFDDNERIKYLSKINEHLLFIKETRDKVNEINSSSVKEIEKIVTIHAQILNKFYN